MNKKELMEKEKLIEYYEYLINSGRVNDGELPYLENELHELRNEIKDTKK